MYYSNQTAIVFCHFQISRRVEAAGPVSNAECCFEVCRLSPEVFVRTRVFVVPSRSPHRRLLRTLSLFDVSTPPFEAVRRVLQRLREAHLFANIKKCEFDKSSVEYLGYIVSSAGISMNPKKLSTILEWPVPQSVTNFHRRFIAHYARTLCTRTRRSPSHGHLQLKKPSTIYDERSHLLLFYAISTHTSR